MSTTKKTNIDTKMFAVIKDEIVFGAWMASSLEQAKKDHPDFLVVEVTLENSPWVIGSKYKK